MTQPTLVAVLGVVGVLGAAALAWLTAAQTRARAEQARQRKDFENLAKENRALWYYTRVLIDWGYRPHADRMTPPEPPESIRHLYEYGATQ